MVTISRLPAMKLLVRALVLTVAVVIALVLYARTGVQAPAPTKPLARSEPRPREIIDGFDMQVLSVSLPEAMRGLGRTVALPDPSVVGTPTQVILDDITRTDTGKYGLLVQYLPDIRLFVEPVGSGSAAPVSVPSTSVAGHPAQVDHVEMSSFRGVAYVSRRARVVWNIGNLNYRLEAATQTVSVERLVEIANSTH